MPDPNNNNYWEDPDFYGSINDNVIGLIGGIMGLVQQGEGQGAGGTTTVIEKDNTPLYWGFGILGFFMLILILVMVFKK